MFDPIYIITMILGYVFMFILASTIAPKVASKFSGRFSLYFSMFLLSVLIISSFSLVLFLVIYFLNIKFSLFNLILSVVLINVAVYLISQILIKLLFNAKEDKKLQKIVDEVKEKLGYKGKLIALKASNLPNVFAFGNFIFGKYIAIADSLEKMLDEKELKAVVAHEIGHHMHKDNAVMLLFGIFPSIIYYIGYNLLYYSIKNREKAYLAITGFLIVLFSFIVQILVLAFSRLREYFADLEGAKIGKEAMQSSLVKIHNYYKNNQEEKEEIELNSFKTLFIYAFINFFANPLVSREEIEKVKNEEYSAIEEILSTHPPIPKRLKFIETL